MASLFGLLKPEIIKQPCTLNQALNKARTKPKQTSHDVALEKWECGCILIILSLVDGKLGIQIFTEEANWMWLRLSNSEAKARDFAKKCIHNIYVYINIIYITHLYSIDSYIYI